MSETNGAGGHTTTPPGWAEHLTMQQRAARFVVNHLSRLGLHGLLGHTHDGKRQMETVFGYKRTLAFADFKEAYLRHGIAQRLVHAYPQETWGHDPVLREDDQVREDTPFEAAWKTLAERLDVYNVLELADIQANLGHYAVVVVGLRGQPDLALPAQRISAPDDIVFLQNYSEERAAIQTWGHDAGQPSFGRPLTYRMQTGEATSLIVHGSRVLHVRGEYRLDNDVYGLPVLEAVYNYLVDLLKVSGGSAEMFWRNALQRLLLTTRDGVQLPEDLAGMQDKVAEFQHGWRDMVAFEGMDPTLFGGSITSPSDHFHMLLQLLGGTRAIPQRVLLGTEEGVRAGQQDSEMWDARVARRQAKYAWKAVLKPLVELCVTLGAVPQPADTLTCDWGKLRNLSEMQQAAINKDRALAYDAYASARTKELAALLAPTVPQQEARTAWFGLKEEPEVGDLDAPDLQPLDELLPGQPGAALPAPAEEAPA